MDTIAEYIPYSFQGRRWNINESVDKILLKEPKIYDTNKFLGIEYNSDGKRKSFAQMFEEMTLLDDSEENDGKRAVYEYLLMGDNFKIDEPRQAFEALYNYKSTNFKNDTIVTLLTQKRMIKILDGMIEQLYTENVHELSFQYLKNGYDGHLYGRTYGNSYYEKASSMIDAVIMRCYNETKEIENGDRKEYTPFVEGVLSNVLTNSKKKRKSESTTIMNQLKERQEKYEKNANAGVVRETLDGYIVSISDIVKITYGPLFDKMQDSGKRVGSFFQFRES
jgi:hypothetical protein